MVARFMGIKVKGSYGKERVNFVELDELKQIDLVNFVERYGYRLPRRALLDTR